MSKAKYSIKNDVDEALIRELEELHQSRKSRFILAAYSILKNYEEAEDGVQEAFYLAYSNLHTFKGKSSLATWVYRILINFCLKKNQGYIKEIKNIDTGEDTVYNVSDFRPNHVIELERIEINSIISRCFDELDNKYSLPLILYHFVGFSIETISDILEIPQGTVKSRLHIARRKMGFLLERAIGGKEVMEDLLGLF